MISPLRRSQRRKAGIDPELARLREEREGVYTDIADLDHDFETGKLDESDYTTMREALRAQAIELLRAERAYGAEPLPEPDGGPAAPPTTEENTAPASAPTKAAPPVAPAPPPKAESAAPPVRETVTEPPPPERAPTRMRRSLRACVA